MHQAGGWFGYEALELCQVVHYRGRRKIYNWDSASKRTFGWRVKSITYLMPWIGQERRCRRYGWFFVTASLRRSSENQLLSKVTFFFRCTIGSFDIERHLDSMIVLIWQNRRHWSKRCLWTSAQKAEVEQQKAELKNSRIDVRKRVHITKQAQRFTLRLKT